MKSNLILITSLMSISAVIGLCFKNIGLSFLVYGLFNFLFFINIICATVINTFLNREESPTLFWRIFLIINSVVPIGIAIGIGI